MKRRLLAACICTAMMAAYVDKKGAIVWEQSKN